MRLDILLTFYLDNEPYGLRKKGVKLEELKGWGDMMKKGGEVGYQGGGEVKSLEG